MRGRMGAKAMFYAMLLASQQGITDSRQRDFVTQELEALRGRWVLVAARMEGQDLQDEVRAHRIVYEFTEKEVIGYRDNKIFAKEKVVLRPQKSPKEMDFVV